ncbi:P-loop NTPase family protein [Rubrivivax gelatinosus]|nr:ATP-binding protein [Rubrivivax gelatinosus]
MNDVSSSFFAIRRAIADFRLARKVEPNATILPQEVFLPVGHRGVLDMRRQLVVGERGMGKSFWTHALSNEDVRDKLAAYYRFPELKSTEVIIGFNGSDRRQRLAPTVDDLAEIRQLPNFKPDLVWKALLLRMAEDKLGKKFDTMADTITLLDQQPSRYSEALSQLDDHLTVNRRNLLIVFDALDRLAMDWSTIRELTRALLRLAIGLQSFRSIRAKIFMRVDMFSDREIFRFQDSSKIKNDHVSLMWQAEELYGLVLFEILRDHDGEAALKRLAAQTETLPALPINGEDSRLHVNEQRRLVHALAGEFMGSNKKRGLVYTWVPLHLSDAANTCSPRTFLTAWNVAAERVPAPTDHAIDHLGLLDGVRSASRSRLNELYEDYEWIRPSLEALQRQFVPMSRDQLFQLWNDHRVMQAIAASTHGEVSKTPAGLTDSPEFEALLQAMKAVAVMDERSNGKINVPDIYRVEAGILRKGGVAVPKRS